MSLAQQLAEYVSACFSALWVQSFEHEDALREIAEMCREQKWRLATWDVEQGLQIPGQANGQPADAGGSDPLAAIRSINALASPESSAILVLANFHPAYKAVTAVRGKVISFWKAMSLPYPEPGIRLIRQDKIDDFAAKMREFQAELTEAVEALDRRYSELKAAARNRLGSLYNPGDYPESLRGLFSIEFDFPSVEPPDYLQQLNPQLYAEECQRVQSRFDEAVRLAVEAFTAELAKLISHLTERLSGQEDGKPRIFRDSAVENLTEFFGRFRELNVRSHDQLDQLVADAQRIIRGVEPQALRDNAGLRQHVATEMSRVQSVLDGLLVDRPRRNILRCPK